MGLPVLEEVFLTPDELVVAGHDAGLQRVYFSHYNERTVKKHQQEKFGCVQKFLKNNAGEHTFIVVFPI